MQSFILEVSLNRPFTDKEIKEGTMNDDEIFEWHEHECFDAIDVYDGDRKEAIAFVVGRSRGVLEDDGTYDLFIYPDEYKKYIGDWAQEIRDATARLSTDDWMFPTTRGNLERVVTRSSLDEPYVYDPDYGDICQLHTWLTSFNSYAENDIHIYVGKIWDYHV